MPGHYMRLSQKNPERRLWEENWEAWPTILMTISGCIKSGKFYFVGLRYANQPTRLEMKLDENGLKGGYGASCNPFLHFGGELV